MDQAGQASHLHPSSHSFSSGTPIGSDTLSKAKNWRQALHQHPELGFQEKLTKKYILDILQQYGPALKIDTRFASTAIVATLQGQGAKGASSTKTKTTATGHPAPLIGLRADMDALPLTEKNDLTYVSQHSGRMHACGHDGHMAMLLGALDHLCRHPHFSGTVCFIFQPAEEGPGGAKVMLEEEFLKHYPLEAVFGLHNWPELPLGQFGLSHGAQMASTDEIHIKIKGKGGHAAFPHQCIDPIVTAAQVVLALQSLVSRNTAPLDSAVLTIAKFAAGHTYNVIPDEVELKGTLRTLNPTQRALLRKRIGEVVQGVAMAQGAQGEVDLRGGYPATINTSKETNWVAQVVQEVFGPQHLIFPMEPSMAGEDFAYFLEKVPGVYIRMGTREEQREYFPLHSPYFNFNDQALVYGIKFWTELVYRYGIATDTMKKTNE